MSGNNVIIGGGGFHHIAIRVRNFEATVRFYKSLGFKEKISWGEGEKRGIMLDTGDGNYIEIFAEKTDAPRSEGLILHYAIRTDDCDAALERARVAGAEVIQEPEDETINSNIGPVPIRIAFFKGPAGELIEFFQSELT